MSPPAQSKDARPLYGGQSIRISVKSHTLALHCRVALLQRATPTTMTSGAGMTSILKKLLTFGFIAGSCISVSAVELAGMAPFASNSFGQQSDGNTPPAYVQAFSALGGSTLTSISWWGYHGVNSMGASFDSFEITLDGVPIAGALSVDTSNALYSKYTLTVAPTTLSASMLAVTNASTDVEWFWQSADAGGVGPHANRVAFSLQGIASAVPEPAAGLTMLLGLAGLLVLRTSRATGTTGVR